VLNELVLKNKLKSINGRDYAAYQSLRGEYDFSNKFKLIIHQIPKDPYAPPHTGIYRVLVTRGDARIVNFNRGSKTQEIAFKDYLTRRFYEACVKVSRSGRGTGYSGVITINQPGQAVLDRNCIITDEQVIEVRCFLGMPASGRQINSELAEVMLLEELPQIVESALFDENINYEELHRHVKTVEDQEYLRAKLDSMGMVAFVAEKSVLPRKSGTSDQPMNNDSMIPFTSPESLRIEIELPHAGLVLGMGIPKGVTLIVGGGYHGKSTLLNALELGCYNHIPGDGREGCASISSTVKIRAYSGRSIVKTDISPFISNLPYKKDTTAFSTENASGSTSQAANIIEAIEVGAKVLLMDEDTCATNFMIRDSKMRQLIIKDDEPITPFIDKVKQLYSEKQISTILVLGGVGDYFDVSDHVIQMLKYEPVDVTRNAHEISGYFHDKRTPEVDISSFRIKERIPLPQSIDPRNKSGKKRIYAKEVHRINFGESVIDLTDTEQLIELSQTKALAYALDYARKYMDQKLSLTQIIDLVMKDIETQGLDILSDQISGHFAEFRSFELACTLNRLRGLEVIQKELESK